MTLTNPQRPLSVFLLLLFILTISFAAQAQPTSTQLNSNLLAEFKWRLVGPSSPAGRVWQVVGDENDPKTFYVCTAGGGLWKSTDNGIHCLGSQRQEKVTDEEATRARVETLSERDALGWVPPGDYTVTLELGAGSLKTEVNVRKERPGVKRVEVRK